VIVVYLVAGIVYNRARGLTGPEMIPNRELWVSVPGLVRDGHVYAYHKLRSFYPTRYEQVSG